MTIECHSCHARFHLDDSLFRGSKGMRVRCRKCGEAIVVMNPKAPPSPPRAEAQKVSEPEEKLIDDLNVPSQDASPPELGIASLQLSVDSTWSEKMGSRHKRSTFIIAALLFLLLGGGAAYLGFTWTGKKLLHRLAVGTESLLSGGATAFPHYIIRGVSTYYVPRTASEKLFVLEGRVENRGRTVGRGIRVRVTLLNGMSQAIATRTFPAGHVFTDEELRHMDRARIEEGLSNRLGEDPTNMEIPPGKFLPFMALFFDLQESIAFYQTTVQVTP